MASRGETDKPQLAVDNQLRQNSEYLVDGMAFAAEVEIVEALEGA
jgi:hypothetical protein